ncbi:uncharacterized protein KRP23_6754 [Phytophthora ramorum]|uniref:uncharacterized protein n=1 Tax=Phytophthora ramorum TaxID=164328 RepID=UPI0030B1B6CE|nr:hypothetical protein KRP23_6754 [Phytophthora ramorum]
MKKFKFSAQYCNNHIKSHSTVAVTKLQLRLSYLFLAKVEQVATGNGVGDDVVDDNVALVLLALLEHLDERLDLIAALLRHGSSKSTRGPLALSWMRVSFQRRVATDAGRRRSRSGVNVAGTRTQLFS